MQPNHATPRAKIVPGAPAVVASRTFTKTSAGRVYDNGLRLRKGLVVTAGWQKRYFPKGHYHFPFYRQNYVAGQCYVSPFGFFVGICVPFIGINECQIFPPATVFIDLPVFSGDVCTGYHDGNDDNLFNDPTINDEQPGLLNAIDHLTEAFQAGNIDGLVTLIDPSVTISIFQNGHYKYSLPSNDYVDIARDAILSMQASQLNLSYLHQRAPGVFSVGGKLTTKDSMGKVQTVWVSYVLQDISGRWTLTQVGTAPARKIKLF